MLSLSAIGAKPPAMGKVTLEHVSPYTPEDAWQDYFAYGEYEKAIDSLGNMALLPDSGQHGSAKLCR